MQNVYSLLFFVYFELNGKDNKLKDIFDFSMESKPPIITQKVLINFNL